MAIDALIKPLLRVELFRGLKPLQITEISRRAFRTVYKPGEVIIEADKGADAAVLIIQGEAVRVSGPGTGAGQVLPEGSLLAEMAMLIETDHTSTVVAKTPVRALRITRSEMHEQMADDQALADHFITRIADRLSVIAEELRAIDGTMAQSEATLDVGVRAVSGLPPRADAVSADRAVIH